MSTQFRDLLTETKVKVNEWFKNSTLYAVDKSLSRMITSTAANLYIEISKVTRATHLSGSEMSINVGADELLLIASSKFNKFGSGLVDINDVIKFVVNEEKAIIKVLKKLMKPNAKPTFTTEIHVVEIYGHQSGGRKKDGALDIITDISGVKKLKKQYSKNTSRSVGFSVDVAVKASGDFERIDSEKKKILLKSEYKTIDELRHDIEGIISTFKGYSKGQTYISSNSVGVTLKVIGFSPYTNGGKEIDSVTIPLSVKKSTLKTKLKPILKAYDTYRGQLSSYSRGLSSHIKDTGGHKGNPAYMD